jgi:hypothetical protein
MLIMDSIDRAILKTLQQEGRIRDSEQQSVSAYRRRSACVAFVA